jgi:MFS family permease
MMPLLRKATPRCAIKIPHAQSAIFPFALGNVLGPLLIGHLFDTVGRKKMISLTYALRGVLLATTGWLFTTEVLSAVTQTRY